MYLQKPGRGNKTHEACDCMFYLLLFLQFLFTFISLFFIYFHSFSRSKEGSLPSCMRMGLLPQHNQPDHESFPPLLAFATNDITSQTAVVSFVHVALLPSTSIQPNCVRSVQTSQPRRTCNVVLSFESASKCCMQRCFHSVMIMPDLACDYCTYWCYTNTTAHTRKTILRC